MFAAAATLVSRALFAQSGASISGVVKDASGAVLPGVTVEASSPALIEKSRTAITDGTGQYKITELLPGTYTVTFTITGFSNVKREGVELVGSFAATVNADMKVGNVAETITVSGEAPIVDVQSTTKQTVITHAELDALPTGKNMFNVGVLIPGITLSTGGLANQDVGGALGPNTLALAIHGGKTQDQRFTMNGISLSTMIGGGWGGGTIPNPAGVSEMLFDTSAVDASLSTGGVRINFIAKDGGNRFAGTGSFSFANDSMQGNNFTQRLKDLGLTTPGGILKNWDFAPGFGGPLVKDKVWFYLSGRSQGANTNVPGQFYNLNANNPNSWVYAPDTSKPAVLNRKWSDFQARVNTQVSAKNRVGFLVDWQDNCFCPFGVSSLTSPEAGNNQRFPLQRPIMVDWSSPVSSKLLLEATAMHRIERWGAMDPSDLAPGMISVTDNGPGAFRPGMTYRAAGTYSNNLNTTFHYRLAASYITGAHAFKFGFNDAWGQSDATTYTRIPYSFQFNTPVGAAIPVPSQITEYVTPYTASTHVSHDTGLFAQDKWTVSHLTVSLGLRYDHAASDYPASSLGPSPLAPNRNVNFPQITQVSWNDITPKMGVTWDVRGDGKTALRVTLNKYLIGFGTTLAIVPDPNPVSSAVGLGNATRSWTDTNKNFVPDCVLTNPLANGECGALSDPNFGTNNVQTLLSQLAFDPNLQTGWGKRGYNWEFSTGIQQQITSRMSIDVGFFRKWYGNFYVADNLALSSSDFNFLNITAPVDPRLPGGGGYTVTGFPVIKPTTGFGGFVTNQNVVKLSDDVGRQIEHWNGVDVNLNARLQGGFFGSGGFSTGRTSTDNCDIVNKLPEVAFESLNFFSPFFFSTMPTQFCKRDGVFLTQVKGYAGYTIPRIDVQVAGTFQSLPGVDITAPLSAPFMPGVGGLQQFPGIANFHIVEPGKYNGDRLNQTDISISKILRFGRTRTKVGFDVYNLFNTDVIIGQNNTFTPSNVAGQPATYQVPNLVLQARFAKFSVQVDF
jgi:hypothetical protein